MGKLSFGDNLPGAMSVSVGVVLFDKSLYPIACIECLIR
jgi:hypothetical protein